MGKNTTFLNEEDIAILTGRKIKRLQIAALRQMGIPFFVNACGRPVVTRSAVEGGRGEAIRQDPAWRPALLTTRKAA